MMHVMSKIGQSFKNSHYQAYLVRLWRESDTDPWRVTIQHIQTQEKQHFASLPAYIAFLHNQVNAVNEQAQSVNECI
jgi:hypothetical protein